MRKYRICDINTKRTIHVYSDTPKNAIAKAYKECDIQIKKVDSGRGNHIVELIGESRKSINYYKVDIMQSMDRKSKPSSYVEPMPKKQLHKIVKKLKSKGIEVIISDESDRYLRGQGNEGSTLNESIILLVKNPSRSAVYEEIIHTEQYRQGKIDGSRESRIICEIEAKKILIQRKEEWNITNKEDEQTKKALKIYEEEYKQLSERG